MKKTGIIIWSIVILLVIYAIITYVQYKGLMDAITDESLTTDLEALKTGDCTKLPSVESKADNFKSKVSSACWNPLMKMVIKSQSEQLTGQDMCESINSEDNEFDVALAQAREMCGSQT